MGLQDFALMMIRNHPEVANNPRNKELIAILQSGDSKKGEEVASNLCKTYGDTKEDTLAKAKSFFHI